MKVYYLINFKHDIIYNILYLVIGMVIHERSNNENFLDSLVEKSLRYQHHKENYVKSIYDQIVPTGLQIKKKPAFMPVSKDFDKRWRAVLRKSELELVKLLLVESDVVISEIESNIECELKAQYPDINIVEKRRILGKRHRKYEKHLKERRRRKWEKFKEDTTKHQVGVINSEFITNNRKYRKKPIVTRKNGSNDDAFEIDLSGNKAERLYSDIIKGNAREDNDSEKVESFKSIIEEIGKEKETIFFLFFFSILK